MRRDEYIPPTSFSEAVISKVSDADFHNVMKDVKYSTTPREVVRVRDMETAHYVRERNERGARYYG